MSTIFRLLHERGSPWLKSKVLFADHQAIVLNKPPGLVCQLHRATGDRAEKKSSFYGFNEVFGDIKTSLNLDDGPYSVHRLDKGTTGCLLLALTPKAAKSLSTQFREKDVYKSYLAIVRGGLKSFSGTSGVIEKPILYTDGRGKVNKKGKPSQTEWELIGSSPTAPISLLKLNLVTGNKHQLRIHLAQCLQTPILGDTVFSRKPIGSTILDATVVPNNRIFLHSSEISFFKHRTISGERYRIGVRSPPPRDFQKICEDVGIPLPWKEGAILVDNEIVEADSILSSLSSSVFP
ncbi:pseudouridine synthase [Phlegmacium glaucopus]|nr:pseudouridine synthase [Phlegmacium glaucopus]